MTQWNASDKSAAITISGSGLIATAGSTAQQGVRADTSAAAGKKYFEVVFKAGATSNLGIGWCNSTASLSAYCGTDKNGFAIFINSNGVYFNAVARGSASLVKATAPWAFAQIAFDIDALKGWARFNEQYWNGTAADDPSTGTGGVDLSTMNAGPYFPRFCSDANGGQVLANFGATSFAHNPPTGFSGLDSNTQADVRAAKMLGYALLAPPQTAVVASKMVGYALLTPANAPLVFTRAARLGYLRR